MVPIKRVFSEGQAEDAILLGFRGLGQWREREKGKEKPRRRLRRWAQIREGNLGPSLAVETPLVQDDSLRRDDFASRGSFSRELTRKNANKTLQLK